MDDVLGEVRRVREAYAERFGFDLAAIFRDVREQERRSGREFVSLPPNRIVPTVDIPLIEEPAIEVETGSTSPAVEGSSNLS